MPPKTTDPAVLAVARDLGFNDQVRTDFDELTVPELWKVLEADAYYLCAAGALINIYTLQAAQLVVAARRGQAQP